MGCIPLISGCFYIEPVWQPPQNTPPSVLTTNPMDIVTFNQSITTITVLASDPDGDNLDFEWIMPFDTEYDEITVQNASGVYRSDVDITADPSLDGVTIQLAITDSFPRDPQTTDVFWVLEVP